MTGTEASTRQEKATRLLNTLQGLGTGAVVLVGGLYIVGLVIVNLNLAQHGVVSLSLARAEYVMAGALWCFLTVAIVGGFGLVLKDAREYFIEGKYRALFLEILIGIPSVLFAVMFVLTTTPRSNVKFDRNALPILVVLLLNGLFAGLVIENVKSVARSGELSPRVLFHRTELPFAPNRMSVIVWAVIAVSLYAAVVFPEIPQELGGGRRPLVRLLVAGTGGDWTREVGLPVSGDGKAIGPVELLMENDGFFIVSRTPTPDRSWLVTWLPLRSSGRTAVGIDKKLVTAVLYLLREDRQDDKTSGPR